MLRRMVCFTALLLVVSGLAGCGSGTNKVEGVVTLDGKPVQGASVSFMPQGGTGQFADGFTDAEGRFTLATSGKAGVRSGTYKVVVTKTDAVAVEMVPGSPEYMSKMKKEGPKAGPPAMRPGGGASSGPKSLLPAVYSKPDTTPLTQKVPPDSSPVKLELKSKE
jgi:hypothetical protein